MKNNIVLIIQARLNSIRFPEKILKKIDNKSVIELLINRVKRAKTVDKYVLAIARDKKNFQIKKKLKNKISIFEGSETNVLDRYYKAANKYKANIVIRVCGDCPFVDPTLIDDMVSLFKKSNYDYLSNIIKPTFPDGLDIEIFTFPTLKYAWRQAKNMSDKEHVTSFILRNKKFKKFNYKFKKNISNLRLTIDNPEDLKNINLIYNKLKNKLKFNINDIYKLYLKNKKLFLFKNSPKRNEGSKMNAGQKYWSRAKRLIPGGNMLLSKRPEMFAPNLWPPYYNKAKGCYIWDIDNKRYLDMSLMGVGTNILGYSNNLINKTVIKSINQSTMSTLNCYEEILLSEKLISMHPHFDMIKYAKTGGEANAIAIRIARAASERDKIAICGYHGWHDWYLSANMNRNNKDGVLKDHLLPGLSTKGVPSGLKNTVFPFKFNDYDELERICDNHKIGVIKMEIFRNYPPKKNFLKKIRNLASKKNIVLIFDECTSGFRETFGGLHLKYGVLPDICILGKALGNGFPITAVLGKKEIMENAQTSFISSTFWTDRTGYVAALKTLEIMEKTKSWSIISKKGKVIKNKIHNICKDINLDVEITGLDACPIYTLNIDKKENWLKYKTFITQELLKNKILGSNVTYVSTSHLDNKINYYLEKLNNILNKINKIRNNQVDIDNFLEQGVCHSGFKRLN